MSNEEIELQPAEILTAIYTHLNRHFFEISRVEAKTRFRELKSGMAVTFMGITAADRGEVKCTLALDHSQFIGTLNFSQFRNALASHLYRIAGKLSNKEDLNIFTSADTGDIIFHIPGVVGTSDAINILVTGVEQRTAGKMIIRLMFLDPNNFQA